jgi:nucleolar MIF4G domain-containing protein 1
LEKHLKSQREEEQEYFREIKKNRVEQLKVANDEDDKLINKYEKLLKLNKRKRKDGNSSISKFNDGLDYLLELCTDDSIQKMYQAAKEAAQLDSNDNNDDDDAKSDAPKRKKKKESNKKKSKTTNQEDLEDDNDSEEEDDFKIKLSKRQETLKDIERKYFGDDEDFFNNLDEVDSFAGSDSEMDEVNSESSENFEPEDNVEEDDDENINESKVESNANALEESIGDENDIIHEDIYGRKRDQHGNVVKENTNIYVPPHLRKAMKNVELEDDPKRREKLLNLKRQINGLVNRLAETNLHRISIDIENVYNCNARNDTNTVLAEIIMNSLVLNVLAKERLVLEHTLLIAVLHANLGSEIGAFFLQVLAEKFDQMFKNIDSMANENKQIDNVIFIICHLYTYKLFKSNIIYEILEKLCERLSEKRIECVLLVLKSSGFILRKDDPVALKEFILKAQKLTASKSDENNSRVMYMLDVLMAIKNNNMTKIPQYDASLVDHFRKLLRQYVRPGKYVTTLALTMDDLLNAEERGKWWLVGSAWTGNSNDGSQGEIKRNGNCIKSENNINSEESERRNQILALAKKQRMNTDTKRNIFYILMTAEDYLDAFEKILSSTNDERTTTAVLLHCCLSEKEYNAYYSVLAQKFCEHNRKFMLAFQYSIWDKIKDIENLSSKHMNNLSRFLIHLIDNDNLALSVLKVVEFAQIEKASLKFVRQVMLGLLLSKEENFHRIFDRIAPSYKLNAFKDQLRLFLKVFLLKDNIKINLSEDQLKMLKSRVQLAEKLLSVKH